MARVVVAEKPAVARDIAAVLGASQRIEGALAGNGWVVTWCIGHLVSIAQPHEMNPDWKPWRWDRLPILPRKWDLAVLPGTRDHFEAVKRILTSPDCESVVCATDAGREGELIFRYVYAVAGCTRPVERLWISSLTPDAIKEGFRKLRPGSDFDSLGQAAEGRARADWLVGMNLSRAYTMRFGRTGPRPEGAEKADQKLLSVGRVQTPTLAMLVDRERAVTNFVPEVYHEVVATFGEGSDSYQSTWFDPAKVADDARNAERLPADPAAAEAIKARCEGRPGMLESLSGQDKSALPPLLYDLTELQRHANRLYGLTAQETLAAAQALYERHKLITYPRTDSRHLSQDVAARLGPVVEAIAGPYEGLLAPGSGTRPLSSRFVDDSKVTDHHAIIPTSVARRGQGLSADEERVYDLVCRRLLMAWHADHKTRVTTAVTRIDNPEQDRFRASGTVVTQVGWKVLEPAGTRSESPKKKRKAKGAEGAATAADEATAGGDGDEKGGEARLPDGLAEGQVRAASPVEVRRKETTPPKRFTDASLLTAMETAGKLVEDRELEEAMKERGLGTPATRAAILETLISRGYLERKGKSLRATDDGCALIDVVHEKVKSPAMTGEWELQLKRMEHGDGTLPEFMARIERYVIEVVGLVKGMRWQERSAVRGLQSAVWGPGTGTEAGTGAGDRSAVRGLQSAVWGPGAGAGTGGGRGTADAAYGRNSAPPIELLEGTFDAPPLPIPDEPARVKSPVAPYPAPETEDGRAEESAVHSLRSAVLGPGQGTGPGPGAGPGPGTGPGTADAGAGRFSPPPIELREGTANGLRSAPPPGVSPGPQTADRRPQTSPAPDLLAVLRDRFRLDAFRPYQEEVCRSVADGRDGLLVMPTGSGKSLCYQLPGLARGGTTLVVSPLIALMEDQVAKLQALGLRAERIHSGRSREDSRAVCRSYLQGDLDFLFIAPERLSVPGFPEMLAKRRLALVAVDEAHCISHWGHDFRPDYRLLRDRLPALKPVPVLALTATATVRVQDDICQQLAIPNATRFIRGFRRDNLALEMVERSPSQRLAEAETVLADPTRRPAIVYVPSRKMAEEIAAALDRRFPSAAYHAGMEADARKSVQDRFQAGEAEVVVATIAFGMGIDKADVRTVLHMALPGSLEAYYQEIGRAGRDGQPARALLFWSYGDRRVHDGYFERAWPTPAKLKAIRDMVPNDGIRREDLVKLCGLEPEVAENAVAKLWVHGGLAVDAEDRVTRAAGDWQTAYENIRGHREAQIDEVLDVVRSGACRMQLLVQHFGERGQKACGMCDSCRPQGCLCRTFRAPTDGERRVMDRVLQALKARDGQPTGVLYREAVPDGRIERGEFERLVSAMNRARLLALAEDAFEKDGKTLSFRRAHLSRAARALEDLGEVEVPIEERPEPAVKAKPRKAVVRIPAVEDLDAEVVERLKGWRLAAARSEGVPAFRILTDKTLRLIAAAEPAALGDLLRVPGLGPRFVDKWGRDVLKALGVL